jgi:pyrroline-5-carboxylate reductase
MKTLDIVLIGCGKMGGALLRGWLKAGIAGRIDVIEPHTQPDFLQTSNIVWHTSPQSFMDQSLTPDLFVMAVKPQTMEEVCRSLAPAVSPETLILSIAAGQTISSFERRFGARQPIIRTMPNTPASIGKGVTVAVANARVTDVQKRQAELALQSTGMLEWTDDESLLDAVTAVSGSGPAYVFLLIEAMAKAGERAGLAPDLAMKLARQTVIGAAALAEHDGDTDSATLRKNVTSPGGTTAAALAVLMGDQGLESLMTKAVLAATDRSRELNG